MDLDQYRVESTVSANVNISIYASAALLKVTIRKSEKIYRSRAVLLPTTGESTDVYYLITQGRYVTKMTSIFEKESMWVASIPPDSLYRIAKDGYFKAYKGGYSDIYPHRDRWERDFDYAKILQEVNQHHRVVREVNGFFYDLDNKLVYRQIIVGNEYGFSEFDYDIEAMCDVLTRNNRTLEVRIVNGLNGEKFLNFLLFADSSLLEELTHCDLNGRITKIVNHLGLDQFKKIANIGC